MDEYKTRRSNCCFCCEIGKAAALVTPADLLFACIAGVILVAFLIAGSGVSITYGLPFWLFMIVASIVTFGGIPLAYRLTAGRQRLKRSGETE
ncbi:MAG: hypothetical protein U9Q07_03880 [Planctomycetota bacterium]|nr:hypothetical protein [Planctomycetota bacterium]